LLELRDVYWTEGGIISVQIALATTALLASLTLALRLLRRGEARVLADAAPSGAGAVDPAVLEGSVESRR
ncbi:MAG TPA: hypothetical protein VHE14_07870, partial [Solirubrobacteraceae bacterium]|nr:hypothetical protein [Solirubrobacteraceae bacterium]